MHAFCIFLQKRGKVIKKGWKITIIVASALLLVAVGFSIALNSNSVQRFLIQKITNNLTENIDANIHIGKVDIGFFNHMSLEDILLQSPSGDSLFYAEAIHTRIDSFRLKKKYIALKQIEFEKSKAFLVRDSTNTLNFQRLVNNEEKAAPKKDRAWEINCNNFKLTQSQLAYTDYSKEINLAINDIGCEVNNFYFMGDSVGFEMDGLAFTYADNFHLKNLSTKFLFCPSMVKFSGLTIETSKSQVLNSGLELTFGNDTLKSLDNSTINFAVRKSEVNLADIASFVPQLAGMEQKVTYSGNIKGTLENLKGTDILISTGDSTLVDCNFSLNGLTELNNMFIFLDIKRAQWDFNDLSKIKLPESAQNQTLEFPKTLYDAGLVTYTGNFTGFLNDFVSYGNLYSKMGEISTDIAIVPNETGTVTFKGELATTDFNAGALFLNNYVGETTFSGDTYGIFNHQDLSIDGTFDGIINSLEANGYTYRNINLNGGFFDKSFDGSISIDDPNLRFDFNGDLNLKPEVPEFDFNLFLYNADLKALNIDPYYKRSGLSLIMKANFIGNSIDNLKGTIEIENGNYSNQNGSIPLNGMMLKTSKEDSTRNLEFFSGFANLIIKGDYNFRSIKPGFANIISHYLPAFHATPVNANEINNFYFKLSADNLGKIAEVFKPELKVSKPFTIEGEIDSGKGVFNLDGDIPGINYNNLALRDISLKTYSGDSFSSKIKLGEIHTENGLSLYNLVLNNEAKGNNLATRFTWNNYHNLTYSGSLSAETAFKENASGLPKMAVNVLPSKIYIADSLWTINPTTIFIDTTTIDINQLKIHKANQFITADGKISVDKEDKLTFNFKNIGLGQLSQYLQANTEVDGLLNGTIGLTNVYGQTFLSSNASISNMTFREQGLGNLTVLNEWDAENEKVITILKAEKNNRQQLFASGYYDPVNDTLSFNARFDHLSLIILEKLIRRNFSNFHGDAIGQLRIHGKPSKLLIDGTLAGKNAGLSIDYTKVSYHFTDSVTFSGDSIIFRNIEINDVEKNTGILDGYLTHSNFKDMAYNLSVNTSKILAINTTPKENEIFYGKIYADGNIFITGQGTNVSLDGDATSLLGTDVNISLDYGENVENYDFIQFIEPHSFEEEKEELFKPKQDTSFNLNLTIRATPEAKVQIIYNSQIGDIIKTQGEGVMRFGMDNKGNIELYGDYRIEQGDYLFTLQNVINKKFTIGQGSSIVWTGNPYNANIDVNAVYKLKASLYELFVNTYENIDYTQRIPVDCKILLTDQLANPTINFDIEFPTAEDRIVDELQQFFNTEEEMNRQILSLLVLGQFYTPEYMRGTYEANSPNVIGTTASELFSNQLSKWLSQISNDVDIGLNYRPGTQLTNDEIELALSTQMFNDRVTINGNIGNNANPSESNNSQLIGDFDLKVKLTDNGKLQLKAYNRSNNNLIYETAPYTQGLGFSFKEEFNTLEELMDKIVNLFRKRNKKTKN